MRFRIALTLIVAAGLHAGELSERLELTLNRVLKGGPPQYTTAFVAADVVPDNFRLYTNYSGDLSGRYVGALASAARESGGKFPQLGVTVAEILKHQRPDGHFGEAVQPGRITRDDFALLWGHGRLLIGLLEYYRLTKGPEVLEAAAKLGDYLLKVSPDYNSDKTQELFSKHGSCPSIPAR